MKSEKVSQEMWLMRSLWFSVGFLFVVFGVQLGEGGASKIAYVIAGLIILVCETIAMLIALRNRRRRRGEDREALSP
jgi:hypothetical protein